MHMVNCHYLVLFCQLELEMENSQSLLYVIWNSQCCIRNFRRTENTKKMPLYYSQLMLVNQTTSCYVITLKMLIKWMTFLVSKDKMPLSKGISKTNPKQIFRLNKFVGTCLMVQEILMLNTSIIINMINYYLTRMLVKNHPPSQVNGLICKENEWMAMIGIKFLKVKMILNIDPVIVLFQKLNKMLKQHKLKKIVTYQL